MTQGEQAVGGSPWYAVYTRHHHEKAVAHNLAGKGLETFLPLYSTARQWRDRTRQLSLPLFPCYVFLRGGPERRLEIISTPGVHSFVSSAGRAAPIPETEIEAVRQVVGRGVGVEPHPFLNCGDWVRVKTGPLEGIEGILVRKKNLFRVVLTVELLEKSVVFEVDVSTIERARRRSDAGAAKLGPLRSVLAWS